MPLNKVKGNMYDWVTHTHCHLGGECPHKCVYCYVKSFPFRPAKYQGELRLIEKELSVNYGEGKTIFIENCNDLFSIDVPHWMIVKIMEHCNSFPENTYVFQSKNPMKFHDYLTLGEFPPDIILGATIETNRVVKISKAPDTMPRSIAMSALPYTIRKFVTIEPILDFDVDILASWMDCIRPEFVNIGADSKGHNLPEPPPEKINELILELRKFTKVRVKDNLKRLLKTKEAA